MRQRERQNDAQERQPAGGSTDGGDSLAARTAAAGQLLAAAEEAIDRALSGDSREFLAANQQHGGQ